MPLGPSQRIGMRPDGTALTAEEEICVELVRRDGLVGVDEVLFLDEVVVTLGDLLRGCVGGHRYEDVRGC